MGKNSKKVVSALLSAFLLTTTVGIPLANAHENKGAAIDYSLDLSTLDTLEKVDFKTNMQAIILENKNDFIDPSYADVLIANLDNDMSTNGKFTLAAKAGGKALQAAMNKIGQKAWDKMISSIEKDFGVKLAQLHWVSVNKLIWWLTNSTGTIGDALTDFLVDTGGFNRTFADILSRVFVGIFL